MTFRNRIAIVAVCGGMLISAPSYCQIIETDSTGVQPAKAQTVSDTASSGIQEAQPKEEIKKSQPVVDIQEKKPAQDFQQLQPVEDIQESEPAQGIQESTVPNLPQAPVESTVKVSKKSPEQTKIERQATCKKTHLIGIGADLGIQIFLPMELNDYIDDVFTRMKSSYTKLGYRIDSQAMAPILLLGTDIGGHVTVRPIPWLAVGVIGRYFSVTQKITLSSNGTIVNVSSDPGFTVSISDGIVGGKVEAFVNPKRTVTFKGGINVEAHFASVKLKEENTVTLSGTGFGLTPFAGLSIAPGCGRVLIDLDFMVPFCNVKLDKVEGAFNRIQDPYDVSFISYPKELNMTGFMIKPSVTICFP